MHRLCVCAALLLLGVPLIAAVDRGSVEVFGNDGEVALSVGVLLAAEDRSLALSAREGELTVKALTVHVLKSAWERAAAY